MTRPALICALVGHRVRFGMDTGTPCPKCRMNIRDLEWQTLLDAATAARTKGRVGMGLDTTHDCWHGSYSAFSRWRAKLAELGGYTLHKSVHGYDCADIDWGNIHATIGDDLSGRWARVPVRADGTPDALIILLAHSDCEGEIQADMCATLADRLAEIVTRMPDEDGGGHIGNWREKTQKFIDGLRLAASLGEPVGFC